MNLKLLIGVIFCLALIFKIFNDIYTTNYCSKYGGKVIKGSTEELIMMAGCNDKILCKLGDSEFTDKTSSDNKPYVLREYKCLRKF